MNATGKHSWQNAVRAGGLILVGATAAGLMAANPVIGGMLLPAFLAYAYTMTARWGGPSQRGILAVEAATAIAGGSIGQLRHSRIHVDVH